MFINWVFQNYIEILGAIIALIYLYFSVNKLIWLWPFGMLSSLIYTWVFFHSRLYADMSLQVYYFLVSIYGWYYWSKKGLKNDKSELPIARLRPGLFYSLLFLIFILTVSSGYFLKNYADSSLPYWDAFTTSASIVATWMLARKILENWLFWIIIDMVSMFMYVYKELYATAGLFLIYSVIAYFGYLKWKKDWALAKT